MGAAMRSRFGKVILAAVCFGLGLVASLRPAPAADLGLIAAGSSCPDVVFTCENGRNYSLCPIAVSVVGEIVTASLYTGYHGATHVRLVPMGVGYRYAGRGVWLDGFRDNALLNFGKHTQIACTIVRP